MSTTATPQEVGTSPAGPRPDFEAHRTEIHTDFPELVLQLREILGRKLVAYIAGVKDTRTIDGWIEGAVPYGSAVEPKIRVAFRVAKTLASRDSVRVIQAWFIGLNPELDDRSPIRLLRDGDPEVEGREVIAAARSFLAGG
jgi:hypothetical protein